MSINIFLNTYMLVNLIRIGWLCFIRKLFLPCKTMEEILVDAP